MAKQLKCVQLGFYFVVGLAGDEYDAMCADRQRQSYAALSTAFKEHGMALFGKTNKGVPEEGGDFAYLPIELCECDWEPEDIGDKVAYSVWFYSTQMFTPADAQKLRDLADKAYTSVCGIDAVFVRAESYTEWKVTERAPYDFPVAPKPQN